MLAFDMPTREFCTIRRAVTNTPLQALVLWNDVQFVEAARLLAQRIRVTDDGVGMGREDSLRISASAATTYATKAGSFRFPRRGTGARGGLLRVVCGDHYILQV